MHLLDKLSDNLQFYYLMLIKNRLVQLKVKRLGEGGTQTFDANILPEIMAEIKCFGLN